MPCTPSLPSSGQRSRGKVLLRSISSARGEMRSAAKPRTLSRSMSAVSPKPKSKPRGSFTRMGADLVCAASRAASKVDIRLMHLLDRARNIAGRQPRPRAGEKRRGNAARLLCKGRRETTMPPRRPSGRRGETHETWLFHDAGASPGKALRRDAQGGSGSLYSRRPARIQRRLLRRAPHRRGREHSQQHDVYRHAAGRDLADESRNGRGQSSAQPSRGRGLERGDARQSVRRPVHLGHRRWHPSLRRRGARSARCRPQRHARGSDRPHPRAVGRHSTDRSQGKILDHFDRQDAVARGRHRRHRQALSKTPSAHCRHRDGSRLQGADRARPARLVADLVALPSPQLPQEPMGQLRQGLRRGMPRLQGPWRRNDAAARKQPNAKVFPVSPKSQDVKQSGLFGFLAQPDAPTKSGVVILPTIFGVNAFVRGYAETLAAAVWDHYEGLPLTTDYEESKARARKLSDGGMHAKVKKWIDYMTSDLALSSVGVLGFCLGGRYVLMAAAQDKRVKACAAAYPSIENPRLPNQEQDAVALAADIRCPVHVVQPGHDHVASVETYAALRENLHKRAAPTVWQYYPDAEHGFMHRKEPAANPPATVIASPQLVAFLKACLS